MRERNRAEFGSASERVTGNDLRIAMIAYTWYPFDARVKRAAEAFAENGHRVDVFTVACDGMETRKGGGPARFYCLRMKKQQTGLAALL